MQTLFRSLLCCLVVASCSAPDRPGAAPRPGDPAENAGSAPSELRSKTSATTATPASDGFSDPEQAKGNAERGKALVATFQCNRCHDGTGLAAMPTEQHCTHCHEDISTGRFGAGTPKIAEWRRSVAPYRYAPSLDAVGRRFRRDWLVRFLGNPYDLRPHLRATMPRLSVSKSQAEDLAAYLTRDAPPEATETAPGNAGTGRTLMEQKGCGGCHEFSGVPPLPSTPNPVAENEPLRRAISLAPDLRHARERFRADTLTVWLLDPNAVKSGTPMPSHGLVPSEARDIAAYVLHAELAPVAASAPRERLPILSRPVTYREVEARVFSITCRHCHGDADAAGGDGGPGNTGGFGFSPRRLDLSDYRGASAGLVGDDGERHSIFEKNSSGVPLLVAALIARQREEAGVTSGTRGMPLGLPAVSAEDVQLVESWIAQGRPR